ncbi:MAG: T9SS type A sorting domain-containing protein [bacterium]|nr:T9SS type A sorting domain-containing protein [bacterium]
MYKKLGVCVFIGIIGVINLAIASAPDTLWTRTYGGTGDDAAYSVQSVSGGTDGFIISGYTGSFGAGNEDVYLIRTNSSGNTLWTKTFGGAGYEEGYSVQQTSDSGFIIAGNTNSFGAGSRDVYLIKTNSSGDTLWTRTFGGTEYDWGYSVQQTEDNGFIIAGETSSFGAGSGDVYLIRTNSSGDTLWTRTYGGTSGDRGHSVQSASGGTGGFIIAGETRSFGAGSGDVYLIRADSLGDTLWTRTYGGTDSDEGYSVQQTEDGGFIVAGRTGPVGTNVYDVYLIKTNSLGDTIWTRTYGGTESDYAYSVQSVSGETGGGFIIVGMTSSFGIGTPGCPNVYLIRINFSGDTLWTRAYGGTDFDGSTSVQQTSDGGFVIAGCTLHPGTLNQDVYLIKIKPEPGIEEKSKIKSPPGRDVATLQILKGKICLSVPNNEYTNTLITIYDLTGRLQSTVYSGTLTKGNYIFTPNIHKSGVYFVKLTNDNIKLTRKLVLIK